LGADHFSAARYAELLQSHLDRRARDVCRRLGGDALAALERNEWPIARAKALASGDADAIEWAEGKVRGADAQAALLLARVQAGDDLEKYAELSARILGEPAGRARVQGIRAKALRRREDLYRRAARWIAGRYARIFLADADGRRLATRENRETGELNELSRAARRQRHLSAPFALEAALRWAVARSGGEVFYARAVDASRLCPICGENMERNPADRAALLLDCPSHGTWDRDHALAMTLWRENARDAQDAWDLHARAEVRSQARIVRLDVELRPQAPRGSPSAEEM
jgi:hypothetical protein